MEDEMEYTFYETQAKQSDIFSIFSVICVRPFIPSINSTVTKLAGSVTKYVTKLCFASMRMCDCKRLSAHKFVDFCLQTTPTTSEVLRCQSPSRCPPSCLTRQTLRRRDVVQSPFTVVEVDLSVGDDHRSCRKPHGSLRSFLLTGTIFQSVTLLVFSRADHSTLQVLTTFYVVWFLSPLLLKACFKSPPAHQTSSDWSTTVSSHTTVLQ